MQCWAGGRSMRSGPRWPFALASVALSGAAYALLFPPFDLPGVAWVALVPLFVAAAGLPAGRAAIAGVAWALVATPLVGAWLPGTVARYFELPALAGWIALLALALVPVGLVLALVCAWIAWATPRGVATPLALGAAFGLGEAARSFAWPPMPWAPLGSGALPDAFVQAADVLGVYGLGILVAACNGALACALVPALRTRRALRSAAAGALGVALAFVYGGLGAGDTTSGELLRVAVVQPGPVAGDASEPPLRALALTRALRDRGHDLVVWPEHALGAYLRERTPATDTVRALSRELPGDLLLGGPHYRYAEPAPRYYASAFLLRDGALVGRHDKTRLVPFAEAAYAPGRRARVLPGERVAVGPLVCAELLFPGVARELARGGAELLANPSNDAWLAPAASEHLLRIARLRAIENRRPLLRATPTGVSAVIDARGRILRRSGFGGGEVLEAPVRGSRATTLTQRLGDWPLALAALGLAAATLRGRRHPGFQRRIHA